MLRLIVSFMLISGVLFSAYSTILPNAYAGVAVPSPSPTSVPVPEGDVGSFECGEVQAEAQKATSHFKPIFFLLRLAAASKVLTKALLQQEITLDCYICIKTEFLLHVRIEDQAACGPVCGDGVCDEGEDCGTCFEDCGNPEADTCEENGCGVFDSCNACQCDTFCEFEGDCCSDFSQLCGCGNGTCDEGEDCESCFEDCGNSEADSCDENGCGIFDLCNACQCDDGCEGTGDCCSDFIEVCTSS